MGEVWVTGARGFIGRHLARYLAGLGRSVSGIGHGHWPEHDARAWGLARWHNAEINGPNLDLLARDGPPATVFHLAGGASVGFSLASPLEDFERTVATTARLLEWIRLAAPASRLVLVSSAAVYGDGHSAAIPESAVTRPHSPYGTHKVMMENLGESFARNFGLRVQVVRLFSVYGPGLEKQLVWDLCERLQEQPASLELGGNGDELRDWLHVGDAVRLLGMVADSVDGSLSPLNGGTGHGVSVRGIAERLLRAWGASSRLCFSGIGRPGDPRRLVADVERARSIGFVPKVALDDGIDEVVAAFRRRVEQT